MEDKKKVYLKPEATVVRFAAEDVLTGSLPPVDDNETPVAL